MGIKLGLRPLLPNKGGLIYRKRHSLALIGDKGEPIRGELKNKLNMSETRRTKGTIGN